MDRTRLTFLFSASIALISLIAFSGTLGGAVIWDDYSILENLARGRASLNNFAGFFTDREAYHAPGEIYRPLYLLSFALDFVLYGSSPRGFHLTNIILHAVNSVLVFSFAALVMRSLSGDEAGKADLRRQLLLAFLAAVLFALHPVHTESVAWIKGRDDILCSIFMLSSFILYIKSTAKERLSAGLYLSSIAAFIAALFSKEMAVTLPLLLLLYGLSARAPSSAKGGRRWLASAPFFVLVIIFVLIRTSVLAQVAQTDYLGGSPLSGALTMTRGLALYLKLLVLPVNLCGDYMGYPASHSFDTAVAISGVALLALAAAAIFSYRRSKPVFFAIGWFFITILPVSNIIPIKIPIAERFLYIPSIAMVLLAAALAGAFLSRKPARISMVIAASAVIAALGLYATIERNKVWKDEAVFWSDVIEKYPSVRAYTNYGLALEERGEVARAIGFYELAVETDPAYAFALNNLAANYLKKGRTDEAIVYFERSIELDPGNATINANLGDAFMRKGNLGLAVIYYERAYAIDPANRLIGGNLAALYRKAGRGEEALKLIRALGDGRSSAPR